eukprot:1157371-Pelagomonas_calceolata.AAC.3
MYTSLHTDWSEKHTQSAVPNIYAPFMGREPLGLPASSKVHTWLPWPAQRTPRPETWHAGQANYARQHCSIG